MPPRKPGHVMQYALAHLPKDTWLPYEDVIKVIMVGVPPHRAKWVAERERQQLWRRAHPNTDPPPRKYRKNDDRIIAVGKRTVARQFMKNRRFEHKTVDGVKYIRVRTDAEMDLVYGTWPRFMVEGLSDEQIEQLKKDSAAKAVESLLRNRGIDPATHVTKREQLQQRSRWWQSLTPEQRAAEMRRRSLKAAETRRKRKNP